MTIETHKSPGVKEERDISMILIVIACALAILFTTLFLGLLPFDNQIVARRDYIVYWATGQQLVHHQNPYDPAALNQIERDAGFKGGTSYYMRNTPWTLPLAFPLGYFGSRAAALPWSLMYAPYCCSACSTVAACGFVLGGQMACQLTLAFNR